MDDKFCWSLTSINTYRFCNKKFKLIYIDKVPQDKNITNSIHFVKGKFIHSIVENAIRSKFSMSKRTTYNPDKDLKVDTKELVKWTKIIDKYLKSDAYQNILKILGDKASLQTEQNIVQYDENNRKVFKGFIDLNAFADGHVLLVDWKSGKAKELEFNQLVLYAYSVIESLIKEGYEVKTVEVRFEFIEYPEFDRSLKLPLQEFLDSNIHLLELYGNAVDKSDNDSEWVKTEKQDKCRDCSVSVPCRQADFKDLSDFFKK